MNYTLLLFVNTGICNGEWVLMCFLLWYQLHILFFLKMYPLTETLSNYFIIIIVTIIYLLFIFVYLFYFTDYFCNVFSVVCLLTERKR